MKITDVEFIPIYVPLAKRYADQGIRLTHMDYRVVCRVRTDVGITGYCDARLGGPGWTPPSVERLIGKSPFEYLNNTFIPPLGGALYDVMGKYLEVPAYKLMGQKVREAVTAAAWCVQFPPEIFRQEVKRAVEQGYTVIKMHTAPMYDVFEQTRAAEEVAPDNFRIHYDFNGSGRTLGVVAPIIEELGRKHPIVGVIEDALPHTDVEGWRNLRAKSRIPLAMHKKPLGGIQEVMQGMADIIMIGDTLTGPSIGDTLSLGIALGRANVQTIMQLTGGTLTKALDLHMAAVLPTMTGHIISLDDQYEEDITTKRIPVIEGFSAVPEAPGLGFEVDEKAIARFAANKPTAFEVRHLGVFLMPGGHKVYAASHRPNTLGHFGREEHGVRGIRFQLLEDDGSPDFEKAYQRVKNEKSFVE